MRIPVFKATLFLSLLLNLAACGSQGDEPMKKSSTKDAEKVINHFHDLLQQKKYTETQQLFSKEFKKTTSWKEVNQIYESCEKLGDIKSKRISSAGVNAAPDGSVTYNLLYNVERTNFNSLENYILVNEGGKIKINYYVVQSEGFY